MRILSCSWFLLLPLVARLSSGQPLPIGQPAPPLLFEQTLPAGMNTAWTALRGEPVVVEFWSTWCANCVAEIPHLNALAAKFAGIRFISVTDEARAVVEPFLAKRPIAGWVALDRDGPTFRSYGIEARPQTMLVDGDGVRRGILHPAQVEEAVLNDLAAGRTIKPQRLKARLRMFEDTGADPVFAAMLRPSSRAKPGGVFGVDPGKLQGDNIPILSYAYETGYRRLEGPEDLLNLRFDFCVLLPDGVGGDTALLREILGRSFQLKLRHEAREMDAVVMKLRGAAPAEFPGGRPMSVLADAIEARFHRTAVDETGLTGRYRVFELPQTKEDLAQALQSQLAIGLVEEKRPVDLLIVESLELPAYRVALPGR